MSPYNWRDHRVRTNEKARDAAALAALAAGATLFAALALWGMSASVDWLATLNWWRFLLGAVLFAAGIGVATLWGVATGDKRRRLELAEQVVKVERDNHRLQVALDDAVADPCADCPAREVA